MSSVPDIRIRSLNAAEEHPQRDFVLYWMIAFRRLDWNFALQRAVDRARDLNKPLVILEALRCGYRWASDRLHRFVIDGMADHARRLQDARVLYYPYLEHKAGAGSGLLEALSKRACVVVTDDYPAFFLPRMLAAAAQRLSVRLEAIDSNGLLPLRAAATVYPTAYAFRRFLQKTLPEHLADFPREHPLAGAPLAPAGGVVPAEIRRRWPAADGLLLSTGGGNGKQAFDLSDFPVDHHVLPVHYRGGSEAGGRVLESFLAARLSRYADERNEPDKEVASGLSPWLHFGHVSAHQVFAALAKRERWGPSDLSSDTRGKREGWWGMSKAAEAFLDELVTWREIGFNICWQQDDYDRYRSLPEWARETLEEHAGDERPHVYTLKQFDKATTHDELWNAAQRQLVREGRIHNYLRMLWGKKILEWTQSPRQALKVMIELNNKYAVDGRDPNSYSGIFWCLGRYDRPWGPERPVFGKIRYMTSESTARKFSVKGYIKRYAE